MRRLVVPILFALLALSKPLAAQEGTETMVRQSVEPATGSVIGQHIAVYVDVLFRDAMPRPPRVQLPDIAGIQAFRFETQGTSIQDNIDGGAYVGQRFEFAIYPRRAGAFLVPPADVTLLDQQGAPTGSLQGTAVQLEVTAPPGVDASQPVVATRHLTLDEQWTPMPDGKFKAGDAIVRTVIREADDVPSLAMLDLNATAPEGVRVYADPPDIEDHVDRGVLTGKRVDRTTYVFSRGGHFDLPAMTQPWWNLADGKLEVAKAPATAIDVAAASAMASTDAVHGTMTTKYLLAAGAVIGLAILAAGAYCLLGLRRRRRRDGRADAFAALRKACTTADPGNIYRAFVEWRRFLAPDQNTLAYERAGQLYSVLFTDCRQAWTRADSQSLIERLQALPRQRSLTRHVDALPPLNPLRS